MIPDLDLVHPEIWITLGGFIIIALGEIALLAVLVYLSLRKFKAEVRCNFKKVAEALFEVQKLNQAGNLVSAKAFGAIKSQDSNEIDCTIALMELNEALSVQARQRGEAFKKIRDLKATLLLGEGRSEQEVYKIAETDYNNLLL